MKNLFLLSIGLSLLAVSPVWAEKNTPSSTTTNTDQEFINELPAHARALYERAPAAEKPAILEQFKRDKKQMMMGIPFVLPPKIRNQLEILPEAERKPAIERELRERGFPPQGNMRPPLGPMGGPPPLGMRPPLGLPIPPGGLRDRIEQMSPAERQAMRDTLQNRGGELSAEEREIRRRALRERFESMTPEQRKQLMDDMNESMNRVQQNTGK